jgi:cyclic pyranopterin phosphate synthase
MNFSHVDTEGNAVMVDVGEKEITRREASAAGSIRMSPECFAAVRDGTVKKGAVLNTARVAGIMAAKRTAEFIPLCHTLNLTHVIVDFSLCQENCELQAKCTVRCDGKTGVEMEALSGVSVALLTVYDMCKSINKNMEIGGIHLIEKSGGKSGRFRN